MSTTTSQSHSQDTTFSKGNTTAVKINASAASQKTAPQGQTLATGKTSDFKSILASQDTGSDFGSSAMADAPDSPKAPLPPLPDLPVRQSHTSNSSAKPTNPPPPSHLSNTSKPDASAQAWVAHTDGRTTNISSQPALKDAAPAEIQQHFSSQQAQQTNSKAPLAKELAQAAKAKEPVAWVAHKDGRLNEIDAEPKLADALPAKVSNKLSDGRGPSKKQSKGFFGQVVNAAVLVAKVVIVGGAIVLAADKISEKAGRQGRGYDHPVKPVNNRGLTGAKV